MSSAEWSSRRGWGGVAPGKGLAMDKLQLTGRYLGRVFNFRYGHLHVEHFWCYQVKLPNLKLKIRHKQLLGSLLLDIAFPGLSFQAKIKSVIFAGRVGRKEQILHSGRLHFSSQMFD